MKTTFLQFAFVACLPHPRQDIVLIGRYKMAYESKSWQKDGHITFANATFRIKQFHLLPYDGKVEYGKRWIMLTSNFEPDRIIDFQTADIEKDTIPFYVHDKSRGGNYLDISIGMGRFIKAE